MGSQILAILFVAQDPVSAAQLGEIYPEVSKEELASVLGGLVRDFNSVQDSVEIREVAGGYRVTTRPKHHEIIRTYLRTKPSSKLSLAALETLAVIAYRQPITLPEIAEIRGVRGASPVRTLLEKKLIETRGRKKTVGRPIMYGVTKDFLIHFGLKDLSDLPTLDEFEEVLSQASSETHQFDAAES